MKKVYISKLLKNLFLLVGMLLFSIFVDDGAVKAQDGKSLFNQNCAACHKLTMEKFVGPGLAGLVEKRGEEWLIKWVRDSKALIESGDENAISIFNEYNQIPMQSFDLNDNEIKAIFSYVESFKDVAESLSPGVMAPTVSKNEPSDRASKNQGWYMLGFLCFVAVLIFIIRFIISTKELAHSVGIVYKPETRHIKITFLLMIVVALALIFAMKIAFQEGNIILDYIFFAAFPYLAIGIFLIGTIVRYRALTFRVSSLSSQFLEGKKLFWGSQSLHWGVGVLFFGHLIAFMFPSTILAWNGSPVRMLILEISSFSFAILALIGLVLLIRRRLTTKEILVVTNKMDMLVYTVLLVQIVSGICVAYYGRWGSSWFASVISPYLASIFTFRPDVESISYLGTVNLTAVFFVKLHIVSAFFIFAIIPFTRFVHILVVPLPYIWRKYQFVIWNWDRKWIRKSTRHSHGEEPRNN